MVRVLSFLPSPHKGWISVLKHTTWTPGVLLKISVFDVFSILDQSLSILNLNRHTYGLETEPNELSSL